MNVIVVDIIVVDIIAQEEKDFSGGVEGTNEPSSFSLFLKGIVCWRAYVHVRGIQW